MRTNSINSYDTKDYSSQRRMKNFQTGALVGAGICVLNDAFRAKDIHNNYLTDLKQIGRSKALVKSGSKILAGLGASMLVYGAINLLIGALVHKVKNILAKPKN